MYRDIQNNMETKKEIVESTYVEKEGKKLSIIESPMNQKQLLFMLQKTPKDHVYKRKGKGGKDWDYVTGVYVKKVLNYVFGWKWNFEVVEHKILSDIGQILVLGKLTITGTDPQIVKMQWGRADIKYRKDKQTQPLDLGNDLKAATTDSLKKCASEIGIASDIYGKEEFQQIREETNKTENIGNTSKISAKKTSNPGQRIFDVTLLKIKAEKSRTKLTQCWEKIKVSEKLTDEQKEKLIVAITEKLEKYGK